MKTIQIACFSLTIEVHCNITYIGFDWLPYTPGWYLRRHLVSLLQQGQYIEVIKQLRKARKLGLKQAKDYVDNLRATIQLKET